MKTPVAFVFGLYLLMCAPGVSSWADTPESLPSQTTLLAIPSPPMDPSPSELRFGLTPYLPRDLLARELQPVMSYLSRYLGIPVRLVIARTYEELSAQLESGAVDIASFSPLSYVLAKGKNPSIRLLAGQIVSGTISFTAYIIVRQNAPIYRLEDLRDKAFAFVDRSSTSGYLFPYALFLSHEIDPSTYFSRTLFAGNHLKAIQFVLDGTADAAATYSEGLVTARQAGIDVRAVRIFKKTGIIPCDAVCARGTLDASLISKTKEALLNLDTRSEAGRGILGHTLRINGWVEVDDHSYDTVRSLLQLVPYGLETDSFTGVQ